MAKPPSIVHVGPFAYIVTVNHDDLDRNSGTGIDDGMCAPARQLIAIRPGLPADYAAETLLHELLHAIMHTTGNPLDTAEEERLIRCISPLLLCVLRQPTVMTYLLNPGST